MKVLIVASFNSGKFSPFIIEQAQALQSLGIEIEYFGVEGKGVLGYFKNRSRLLKKIKEFSPQLIHAHYSLSGLLANLQRRIPVITTYHGSDINNPKVFLYSRLNMLLSAYNIFVSEKNKQKSGLSKNQSLIPCGVDITFFKPLEKEKAREILGLDKNKKLVLFAGAFNNSVKNPVLAQSAVALLLDVTLIELRGYTREQVVLLMNAVDATLMTSFSEGSPQFIKEAMACNCPIISTDVGDVRNLIDGVEGCYISIYEPNDVSNKINQILSFNKRTNARDKIIEMQLDMNHIVNQISEIYNKLIQ